MVGVFGIVRTRHANANSNDDHAFGLRGSHMRVGVTIANVQQRRLSCRLRAICVERMVGVLGLVWNGHANANSNDDNAFGERRRCVRTRDAISTM